MSEDNDSKPKTIFALRISQDKRFYRDMWHMSIILVSLLIVGVIVMLIQYAFCHSIYPDMGFKDCMAKNLMERPK